MVELNEIRKPIANEWHTFETLFETAFQSHDTLLQSALSHVMRRKGKQIRPTLTLLAAQLAGNINARTHLAAAALEVLHTASLLHDDVVDCTNERRGCSSVNAQFGNKTAILVGDYLLTKAMELMVRTDALNLVKCLAELGKEITRGELLQLQNAYQPADETVYYETIRRKTAALFACCTLTGALSVGATPQQVEALHHFGEHFGICFQIKDDIFDYTPQAHIGKPTLNDLREGKFTLPLIYAMRQAPETETKRIVEMAKNADEIDQNKTFVQQFVAQYGGIAYAHQKMNEFRQKSLDYLAIFDDSDTKQSLCQLLDFALEREN